MKRLRRRLFLHFGLQYISLSIGLIILFILIVLILIVTMTNHEAKLNYYQTKINSVAMDTDDSINQFRMSDNWDKDFKKEDLWVQVIDHNGRVVEQSNVPSVFPEKYNQRDLYLMQKEDVLHGYSLYFYLETTYKHPYLFVLGRKDQAYSSLEELIHQYASAGKIPEDQRATVEAKLKNIQGYLRIRDTNDTVIQSLGQSLQKDENPLDIALKRYIPDSYATHAAIYEDPQTQYLWVLEIPNEKKKDIKLSSLQDVIMAFAISVAILLVITVGITFWNGFRYGNPLFIFTSWLSRMGNGQYKEVLTEKEKKLIFRKNGKIRLKYRLYSEVFQAFYDMAEKLNASEKERAILERTRDEWMSGISHDLRTPLTSMQGYGKLLESGHYDWSAEELKDIGQTIDEKSKYMLSLIEDFSLSFQLKNSHTQSHFQPTEMCRFMNNIVKKFKNDKTLQNYVLEYRPSTEPFMMNIAERWFERMIDNLIYNAIKHNPCGTNINVSVYNLHSQCIILIEDNGIGMDEETRTHLFDRYYRGTNTDVRTEGSGLGMSIALQIAQIHNGSITVGSSNMGGLEVKIILPISK